MSRGPKGLQLEVVLYIYFLRKFHELFLFALYMYYGLGWRRPCHIDFCHNDDSCLVSRLWWNPNCYHNDDYYLVATLFCPSFRPVCTLNCKTGRVETYHHHHHHHHHHVGNLRAGHYHHPVIHLSVTIINQTILSIAMKVVRQSSPYPIFIVKISMSCSLKLHIWVVAAPIFLIGPTPLPSLKPLKKFILIHFKSSLMSWHVAI